MVEAPPKKTKIKSRHFGSKTRVPYNMPRSLITGEIGSTASRSGSWERRLAIASAFLAFIKKDNRFNLKFKS